MAPTALFHVSDSPFIERFDPRSYETAEGAVVWAIDDERLRNYLVPRDCPRVTFYAGPRTTDADRDAFLSGHRAVLAIEAAWLERVTQCRLYVYQLPVGTFALIDEAAGYYTSRASVVPERVDVVDNVLEALQLRGVDVRVLPSLRDLQRAVAASTLEFSMIRMRNAGD